MLSRGLGSSAEDRSWHWMVLTSLLLHGTGLLTVWGLERYAPRKPFDPSVISVRLVGSAPSASMSPAEQGSTKTPPQSRPSPPPESPSVSPSRIPLPVPQAERKAVSINPSEVKVPERKAPVKPAETPAPQASKPQVPGQGSGPSASDVGPKVAAANPGAGGGGKLSSEEARYLQMLQERIEESWRAFVTGEEGILGEVRIQVAPDGKIREFTFLKGSGKSHVDSTIVSALKKVSLAPPPASLADRPLILRFWPSGPGS